MAEKSDGPKDLFGDAWTPPRDPRGRKRHRRTSELAEKVGVLKATGSSESDIALRIGLSLPTLRKYYFRELSEGHVLARQVLIERQWAKAVEGNTPAARFIREELAKGDANAVAAQPTYAPQAAPRLGKKEQQQLAAEQVDGIFAPGAPPAAKATPH